MHVLVRKETTSSSVCLSVHSSIHPSTLTHTVQPTGEGFRLWGQADLLLNRGSGPYCATSQFSHWKSLHRAVVSLT